jgi:benzoyl-CoA reductase/2-hydroxyglutaryl-CoA dehydratase subunit BcrC/BadD/HgdB
MSDPELKAKLIDLLKRYNKLRAALRQVYRVVHAPSPINLMARLADVERISGAALGRGK